MKAHRLRAHMVDDLLARSLVRTDAIRDAFAGVPRELFVPDVRLHELYKDAVFVTNKDRHGNATSSSSMPAIMGIMLEQLDVRPGHRVLEIGTGTGYNAAILKTIVGRRGRVASVELDPGLASKARAALRDGGYAVRVVTGDGRAGWEPGAPYDRIIATASAADIPDAWMQQLAPEGVLVLPLRLSAAIFQPQLAVAFHRRGARLESVATSSAGFMGMRTSPDEDSPRDPHVRIAESVDGNERTTLQLSGAGIASMTSAQRRTLVALMAGPPRVTRLRERRAWWDTTCYVALAAPEDRLVAGGRGVVAANGRGLALIAGDAKGADRVLAWGTKAPEQELLRIVRRGVPPFGSLRITVSSRARPDAWRTSRRGASVLSFSWDRD